MYHYTHFLLVDCCTLWHSIRILYDTYGTPVHPFPQKQSLGKLPDVMFDNGS